MSLIYLLLFLGLGQLPPHLRWKLSLVVHRFVQIDVERAQILHCCKWDGKMTGLTGEPLPPPLLSNKSQDYSTEILVSPTKLNNTDPEVTNAINVVCAQRTFSAASNNTRLIGAVLQSSLSNMSVSMEVSSLSQAAIFTQTRPMKMRVVTRTLFYDFYSRSYCQASQFISASGKKWRTIHKATNATVIGPLVLCWGLSLKNVWFAVMF